MFFCLLTVFDDSDITKLASKLMEMPEEPEPESRVFLSPRLMAGEMMLGFLSIRSLPPRIDETPVDGLFTSMRLREQV